MFHAELLRYAGNNQLVELATSLRSRTRMYGLKILSESNRLADSAQEHHDLLDLIEAGDGPRHGIACAATSATPAASGPPARPETAAGATDMNAASDVLVIGAGVIGAATAYFATQQGLTVTVLDKGLAGQRNVVGL